MSDLQVEDVPVLSEDPPCQMDDEKKTNTEEPPEMTDEQFQLRLFSGLVETLMRRLELFPIRRVSGFQMFKDHIKEMHKIRSASRAAKVAQLLWTELDDSSRNVYHLRALRELESDTIVNSRVARVITREIRNYIEFH